MKNHKDSIQALRNYLEDTVRDSCTVGPPGDERFDLHRTLGTIHSAIVFPVAGRLAFHPTRLETPFLVVAWHALGGPRAERRRQRRRAEEEQRAAHASPRDGGWDQA